MELYKPFMDSTLGIIHQMTGVEITGMDELKTEAQEIASMGVSSIINFAGKRRGRLFIDMEPSLALKLANTLLGEQYIDTRDYMVLATVSEINNIISGDAITFLNNQYSLSLRLTPPIVFSGRDALISIPKIESFSTWGTSDYGSLRINIAWEGGV